MNLRTLAVNYHTSDNAPLVFWKKNRSSSPMCDGTEMKRIFGETFQHDFFLPSTAGKLRKLSIIHIWDTLTPDHSNCWYVLRGHVIMNLILVQRAVRGRFRHLQWIVGRDGRTEMRWDEMAWERPLESLESVFALTMILLKSVCTQKCAWVACFHCITHTSTSRCLSHCCFFSRSL